MSRRTCRRPRYDDGSDEDHVSYGLYQVVGVKFSLPLGWVSALLLSATIMMDANLYGGAQQAKVHVLDATGKIDLVTPFSLTLVGGWNTVSIPSALVSGDFYVAFECGTGGLDIRIDTGPVTGHSFSGNIWESDGKVHFFGIRPQWNYMIRAYVDPAPEPAPVGGVVIPANAFVLISPWLAVIGLVGCIGTVVVVAKKRQG